MVGGGLLLLSRFPIEQTHTVTYRNASRFLSSGFKADGFAAKGALHARLRLGDDPSAVIDCFLTHLESRSDKARDGQIDELAEFIKQHAAPGRPMIVLGDFNVTADRLPDVSEGEEVSQYGRLRQKLPHDGGQLVDVWPALRDEHGGTSDALAEDGGRRIDYIFLSKPNAAKGTAVLRPREVKLVRMLDEDVPEGSLSDHCGVACLAEFRWAAGAGAGEERHEETPNG